jgi:hypothetical protein
MKCSRKRPPAKAQSGEALETRNPKAEGRKKPEIRRKPLMGTNKHQLKRKQISKSDVSSKKS